MQKMNETYTLNETNIDIISEKITEVCSSLKLPSDQTIRVRLLFEEILIEWLKKNSETVEIEFKSGMRFFRPVISLSYKSSIAVNPLKSDERGIFLKAAFEQLTFSPDYSYERGRNIISVRLKKTGIKQLTKLILIIACSIIFGFWGQLLFPESVITILQQYIITPTYEKFLDILNCIAGPLIFFSVAWGIYGIGDTTTLNKLGKGMILFYLRDVFFSVVVCVVFFPLFGCVISSGNVNFTQILSIYTMFLDMIPVTIVEPFASGNTIQIILLAIIVGIALLCLGRKTRYVAVAVEQINLITNFLMEAISKLVPFFISMLLINMIWSGKINILANSWFFLLSLAIALLLTMFTHLIISSICNRVKISKLIKKTFPSFIIALSTASSAASFSLLVKNCEKDFGIDASLTSFGIPLGIIIHKVATAVNYILISFYIAGVCNVECSLSWIILAVIISAITAIAIPPIPGGSVIGFTMLFSQLGLPEEGLAMALAIDVVADFLTTSTNIFCLPIALTGVARRFDLLDMDTLRK